MTTLEKTLVGIATLIIFFASFLGGQVLDKSNKLGVGAFQIPTYNYLTDLTSATTTLATYPGTIHSVTVATPVANSVITIYDSASSTTASTVVARITVPSAAPAPFTLLFDTSLTQGLTVVQTGASSTMTISYKQN
jgi:hypothetical protein